MYQHHTVLTREDIFRMSSKSLFRNSLDMFLLVNFKYIIKSYAKRQLKCHIKVVTLSSLVKIFSECHQKVFQKQP